MIWLRKNQMIVPWRCLIEKAFSYLNERRMFGDVENFAIKVADFC